MEAFSLHSLTIFSTTFLLFISHIHPSPIPSSETPENYTNFVENSCNETTYPSLCIKTLTPYASTVKTNPLKLCNTALNIAVHAARNCSVRVSPLVNQSGLTLPEARAIKDCIGDLKDAVYELKQTLNAMGLLQGSDREFEWANAKTYASAAITDAETCIDGFLEYRKLNLKVKNKIRGCVSDVEKLISNALALINHLY